MVLAVDPVPDVVVVQLARPSAVAESRRVTRLARPRLSPTVPSLTSPGSVQPFDAAVIYAHDPTTKDVSQGVTR
jgi:hypothetical protein